GRRRFLRGARADAVRRPAREVLSLRRMASLRVLSFAFLLGCAASAARADTLVLRPGPEGIDTAPYQFTPALSRGDRETLYAFTDPEAVHSFETFVRFELPEDLVGPDEEIAEARLVLHYGFDFDVYGDT